ncbi:MAG: hypothetical protein KA120_09340 [Candidatus Goldbacteria bacterium]|nr:hypothetical protein [Candidatus Goldiibacteriota bacterium]
MPKKKKNYEKKLDMAEHDSRLKMLGFPDRVTKFVLRILLVTALVVVLLIWLTKIIK